MPEPSHLNLEQDSMQAALLMDPDLAIEFNTARQSWDAVWANPAPVAVSYPRNQKRASFDPISASNSASLSKRRN